MMDELDLLAVVILLCIIGLLIALRAIAERSNTPEDDPGSTTIRCPNCGSPAKRRGDSWECPWCGDCGRIIKR